MTLGVVQKESDVFSMYLVWLINIPKDVNFKTAVIFQAKVFVWALF